MKTIIIAEAGVNHNGQINMAKKLVEAAANADADYVKFQTFKADLLVTKGTPQTDYQREKLKDNKWIWDQHSMLKKLELDRKDHLQLMEHCREYNIKFLSSAFNQEGVDLLYELGIDFFKIPSGDITNYPLLRKIATKGLPVVMSTGMSNINEIKEALEVLSKNGLRRDQVTLLQCNTEYPTPMEDVNLLAMQSLKEIFDTVVGYSDHTLGIEIPIAAVAMGAKVIEKHFTLDRNMDGPDHAASLEPDELMEMVRAIRNVEMAMGDGKKQETPSEMKNKPLVRKSIVARVPISKGTVFTDVLLSTKRPGIGISPMRWEEVIGKKAKRDFNIDDLIEL